VEGEGERGAALRARRGREAFSVAMGGCVCVVPAGCGGLRWSSGGVEAVRGRTNRALLQRRHALVWMPSEESAGRQETRRTGARWIDCVCVCDGIVQCTNSLGGYCAYAAALCLYCNCMYVGMYLSCRLCLRFSLPWRLPHLTAACRERCPPLNLYRIGGNTRQTDCHAKREETKRAVCVVSFSNSPVPSTTMLLKIALRVAVMLSTCNRRLSMMSNPRRRQSAQPTTRVSAAHTLDTRDVSDIACLGNSLHSSIYHAVLPWIR
jgi:hypothetical protein